ncbi:hypothetical protein C8J56DRAFT_786255 [Mycena floridula]|nr:hypothetical protein C8J56DRAFT_786255 [Mycena floridula]
MQPDKQRPGRPKGSKNKKKEVPPSPPTEVEPISDKRPRGRPRKEKEVDDKDEDGNETPKRGPGRPRNEVQWMTTVLHTDAPLHHVAGINTDAPIAPIFARAAAPQISEAQAPMVTGLPEIERLMVPVANPNHQVQQSSSSDEDDGFYGLMGEGFGEDLDDCSRDEDEDEEEGQNSSRSRLPLPPWLMQLFNNHLDYICRNTETQSRFSVNRVYKKNKSFWLPQPDTFFLLQKAQITPTSLYNPRFFFWDPLALVDSIPCPNVHTHLYADGSPVPCKGKLIRHEYPVRPRCIIDFEESFYLIGMRYRCNLCHPRSTFQSWDARVLSLVPSTLAEQFPAMLSHRSGISKKLFAMMRCSFQNGVGAKQFSYNLNVLHRRRYEMLEVQYMETILARAETSAGRSRTYLPFPEFEDKGPNRFNALIPSGQWLRDMYDKFIESHEKEFDQHTSTLGSDIYAIDHSHKIVKHIGKIEGQRVFDALLTVTNGMGQIRVCDLVPTKAHSQFTDHLARMNESFKIYGLPKPKVFFTDNLWGDKRMLEESFPSLRENVTPVTASNNLPPATITVPITVLSTITQMQDAILSLVECIPEEENGRLIIGLDLEWNTAILQIAYDDHVWIFQLGRLHINSTSFPSHLAKFLANPRVIKAGRNVQTDLRYLEEDSGTKDGPFVGGIDIADFAKEKGVVKSAKVGLAELCASVLKEKLEKPNDIRVGMEWGNEELSDAQQQYAALDAWISLRIYQQLVKLEAPSAVIFPVNSPPVGLEVFVFQDDRTTIIARGTISPHAMNPFIDNINITPTRTVVDVTEVYVPGAIITTHHHRNLADFGPPNFSIVCLKSRIKTYVPNFCPRHSPIDMTPLVASSPIPEAQDDTIQLDLHDEAPVSIDFSEVNVTEPTEVSLKDIGVDSTALQECNEIIERLASLPWPGETRSRVLKDIFHVFQLIYIVKTHGLRVTFAQALREAIFIPDLEDKRRMVVYLARQSPPMTWEECLRSKPGLIKKHCRHVVPLPEQLYPVVSAVFKLYGPLKDAATGLPLFNAAAWKSQRISWS